MQIRTRSWLNSRARLQAECTQKTVARDNGDLPFLVKVAWVGLTFWRWRQTYSWFHGYWVSVL